MNTWERIDLWPKGPAGVEARWRKDEYTAYCFIGGSDHWIDWIHHILPGAKTREIIAGECIANRLKYEGPDFVIGGHSLGGAVASVVTNRLRGLGFRVTCYVYGAKRPPEKTGNISSYINRGDIVPYLFPWRPKHINPYIRGKFSFKAHGPRTYYDLMVSHKLREAN